MKQFEQYCLKLKKEEDLTKGGSGVTVKNDCNTSKDFTESLSDNEIDGVMSDSDTVINESAETLNLMHE